MKTTLPRQSAPKCRPASRAPIRIVQFGAGPCGLADRVVECQPACHSVGLCSHWPELVALFCGGELRYVLSHTAAADLAYAPEPVAHGMCPPSFAGKVTALLYRRFVAVRADPHQGLTFLPAGPGERNGDRLAEAVLEHARNWALPGTFAAWVRAANRFINLRVEADASRWIVDAPPMPDVPFDRAGLDVVWARGMPPLRPVS